jgi:hypothetical protein
MFRRLYFLWDNLAFVGTESTQGVMIGPIRRVPAHHNHLNVAV